MVFVNACCAVVQGVGKFHQASLVHGHLISSTLIDGGMLEEQAVVTAVAAVLTCLCLSRRASINGNSVNNGAAGVNVACASGVIILQIFLQAFDLQDLGQTQLSRAPYTYLAFACCLFLILGGHQHCAWTSVVSMRVHFRMCGAPCMHSPLGCYISVADKLFASGPMKSDKSLVKNMLKQPKATDIATEYGFPAPVQTPHVCVWEGRGQ